VLGFEAECGKPIDVVELSYKLLFDVDPQHKGLLSLEYKGTTSTGIFSPIKQVNASPWRNQACWRQFLAYAGKGMAYLDRF